MSSGDIKLFHVFDSGKNNALTFDDIVILSPPTDTYVPVSSKLAIDSFEWTNLYEGGLTLDSILILKGSSLPSNTKGVVVISNANGAGTTPTTCVNIPIEDIYIDEDGFSIPVLLRSFGFSSAPTGLYSTFIGCYFEDGYNVDDDEVENYTPTPIPDLTTCSVSASPDDNTEYANSFVISTSSASTGIAVAELKVEVWFTASGNLDPDIDKDSPDYIFTGLTSGEPFNFYPIREHQNTSGKFTVASFAISEHDDADGKIGSVGNATVVTFDNSFPSNYIKLEPPRSLSVNASPDQDDPCAGEYSFKDSLNIVDQAGGYVEEYDVAAKGKVGEREITPDRPLDPYIPDKYFISNVTSSLGPSDYTITNDGNLLFTDPLSQTNKIIIIFIPQKVITMIL